MTRTKRFASTLCSADDVACRATRHTRADEETSLLPTVVIPRRGVFEWHSGGKSTVAEPNTVLLFDPERPHRIIHPTDEGDDCTAVRFLREQIDEVFGPERSTRHWILDGDSQIELHLATHRMRNASDTLEGEEAAMAILRILARTDASRSSSHRVIELVRERIAADPGERATLAELAHGSGLSAFELARRFRAVTGSSIHQYRLRLRVLLALSRLQDGEDDITAVALDLGFANHAHFTSTFARAFKRPPRALRRFKRAIVEHEGAL